MEKEWYVIHTYSGYENKVKTNLERRVESMNMEEEIFEPEEPAEELPEEEISAEETPVYKPRPTWQVWAARIGLVIMIICVILYYWHIASGGKI
jgi:transcriptional antiterminator NusG